MRTDTEMLDLVRTKVHRRRTRQRTLAALAGGSLAAVLLVATVALAAGDPSSDGRIQAGPGETTEPTTSTTEPSTTSTEPIPTTATIEPAPSTTASTAPLTTTTEAPSSTTEPGSSATQLIARDGDLEATFTLTTDPARPGVVVVRIDASDPTGRHYPWPAGQGMWGIVAWEHAEGYGPDADLYGDSMAGCGGGTLSGPAQDPGPDSVQATIELTVPSGTQRIRLVATSLFCMDEEDFVEKFVEVDVP